LRSLNIFLKRASLGPNPLEAKGNRVGSVPKVYFFMVYLRTSMVEHFNPENFFYCQIANKKGGVSKGGRCKPFPWSQGTVEGYPLIVPWNMLTILNLGKRFTILVLTASPLFFRIVNKEEGPR